MFHPTKWQKLSKNFWLVNDVMVGYMKEDWYCDTCKGEIFRMGGRKQSACKHVRFVIRKEKIKEKIRNEGGKKNGTMGLDINTQSRG